MTVSCEMTSPGIHLFVEKRNHRLQYTVFEIFMRRMGISAVLVADIDDFEAHTGPKLNYSTQTVSEGIPTLAPLGILFEKRIQPHEIEWSVEGDLLFPIQNHVLGFDPLAAIFYLLSRYEEYLPHRKDEHGRFLSEQSVLVEANCHQVPLVELYVDRLFEWLAGFYPSLKRSKSSYTPWVTLDVDQLFSMKAKGLVRSVVSTARDALRGRLMERTSVMLGRKSDPNDIYDRVDAILQPKQLRPVFFMQVGESSRYDVNNPPHLYDVRQRINEIALSGEIGLHPSYYSSERDGTIARELERLRQITSSGVSKSRQHFLRFILPQTFRTLAESGVTDDFSIGFHDRNGFRAGTCKPFGLFDLEKDETIQLTMYPMAWMDLVATRNFPREQDAWEELDRLLSAVKAHGGHFVSTWHPDVMAASDEHYSTWNIFERFVEHA
ncbi:MAG: hypothetical protein RLP15_12150 [Cryomorphaceae bacterium]